jgi:hypothetical protein
MTTMHQKLWIIAIVTFSFFMMTCRKDISVPDTNLEKLFGTWNWVQSTGGFGGQTITPTTTGYSQTVEFGKNGINKIYKNGKQQDKYKFTLTLGTSIHSTGLAYLINYKHTGLFHYNESITAQSIMFGGQDSLFLCDEASDGYDNIYTRK